jgi:hypothetical protein
MVLLRLWCAAGRLHRDPENMLIPIGLIPPLIPSGLFVLVFSLPDQTMHHLCSLPFIFDDSKTGTEFNTLDCSELKTRA